MSVKGMPQKFVDRVEDLKHYTKTEIDALQECCCPMVKDIYLNYQFEYWYDGEKINRGRLYSKPSAGRSFEHGEYTGKKEQGGPGNILQHPGL